MGRSLLKPEHISRYYAKKLAKLSARTVRHHHEVLHNALNAAVKWGYIIKNPADAVSPPRCQRYEARTMSEDDIRKLMEAAESTPYYCLFFTALYTGMRRSELLGLRWSDIDLLLRIVCINRTYHHLKTVI